MVIARALVTALETYGHAAELVVTPDYGFGGLASTYLANWRADVTSVEGRAIDQVISLRYPSYAVRHPHHVSWLNHTMREYYDLWNRFHGTLSRRGRLKERVRRTIVRTVDRQLLSRNLTKLFVQSATIRRRLEMWPELRPEILYPPPPQRPYRCEGYGDFVFLVSRLTPLKRVDLFVEALATADGQHVRAVVAGDGDERARLEALIARLNIGDRVRLVGHIGEAELLDYLARCRAVCFPPLDEDYGFVTAEAFASRKAVITCVDSGGPAELVQPGVTGFVTEPTPPALAAALRRVMEDRAAAERMGEAAHAAGTQLTWEDAVRRLTA